MSRPRALWPVAPASRRGHGGCCAWPRSPRPPGLVDAGASATDGRSDVKKAVRSRSPRKFPPCGNENKRSKDPRENNPTPGGPALAPWAAGDQNGCIKRLVSESATNQKLLSSCVPWKLLASRSRNTIRSGAAGRSRRRARAARAVACIWSGGGRAGVWHPFAESVSLRRDIAERRNGFSVTQEPGQFVHGSRADWVVAGGGVPLKQTTDGPYSRCFRSPST